MRVTFYSNFMNHHQLPFSLAMDKLTGGNYTFVATTAVPQGRLNMGYHDMNKQYPFVLTTYDSPQNAQEALVLALCSDVVITGSAPEMYTKLRMERNRLTFRYSERIFKKGLLHLKTPHMLASMVKHHTLYCRKPLYMLCASAYMPFDTSLVGAYRGKSFKWGYFPEVKKQSIATLLQKKSKGRQAISILWAGRLINWKHPEAAIQVAERLRHDGYSFDMQIIGNGEMEEQLQQMIHTKQLDDCVHMLGAMSPEAVRDHMEASDIFLFTSDFNEGWGAVLNESMNSGCAVVASHAIGSVPFLIQDGVNGLIYKNGDINSLYAHVEQLIREPDLRDRLGRNAYQTLADQWNAEVAAERFLQLTQALLDSKSPDLFEEGPCSRAKVLRNGWYKG
jgi:glycosyltransferase involved in cell wall biosynthesis